MPNGIAPLPHGGFRVFVRVADARTPNGRLVTKRFPAGTPERLMLQWREDQRVQARRTPVIVAPAVTGFAADAARYLAAVQAMPSYADRARDLAYWVAAFGTQDRTTITSSIISTWLASWRQTKSASTVNHRRTALMHLWTVLDGRHAANPVRETPKYAEPDPAPRGLSYAAVRLILGAMRPSKTKACLEVIAYTGVPFAQIGRLQPVHLDLAHARVWVTGRRKGGGTKARQLGLTPAGVAALRSFVREEAWGQHARSSRHRSFRLAVTKARALIQRKRLPITIPPDVRPYDLRHAFGTAAYAASGDIRATQILMGHSRREMTDRYTLGAVDPMVAAALRKLGETLPPPVTTRRKPKKKP